MVNAHDFCKRSSRDFSAFGAPPIPVAVIVAMAVSREARAWWRMFRTRR